VKKSLDAANAITAGKISSRATSISSVIIFPFVRPNPPSASRATVRCDLTTDSKESVMRGTNLRATIPSHARSKKETAPQTAGPF
jgi:hypothetical protein